MVVLDINEVKIGDVVAAPVMINNFEIVKAGTVVYPSLVDILKNLGIKKIWIANLNIEYKKLTKLHLGQTKLYNNLANFAKTYSRRLDCYEDVISDYDSSLMQHSVNVSMITGMILSDYKLPLFQRKNIIAGALLHDLGKLDIEPLILNKPGKLTPDEYEVIKQHTIKGFVSAGQLRLPGYTKDIILHHHENYDGSGYPEGISKDSISLGSMAVHIADVYEARCSKRVYKDANARVDIKEDMKKYIGTMFDEEVFKHFEENVPTYFRGEIISVDGNEYVVVGYTENKQPILQCIGTGKIFTHDELVSSVKEVFIVDSIHVRTL